MRIALIISVLMTWIAFSSAHAAGWTVDRVGGRVMYTDDGRNWLDVQAGQSVPSRGWIRTGFTGRVILSRGTERILFRPNTLASILNWEQNGENTKVVQRSGSILLDLEIRARRHAQVVTPHLAAVVKGTVFEVSTTRGSSQVRVDRGQVDVRDGLSSKDVSITSGQRADVNPRAGSGVTVSRATPPSETIASIAAQLPAPAAAPPAVREPQMKKIPDIELPSAASGAGEARSNAGGNSGNNNGNAGKNGNGNAGGNGNGNGGGNGNGNGNGGGNGNGNNGNGN